MPPSNPPGGGLYPPQQPQPAPPQPAPIPPPPQPDNLLPWRNEIERRIAELENRKPVPGPQGPPGRDGKDGRDGLDGRNGSDGASADNALIVKGVIAAIRQDVELQELLRGPRGYPGTDGADAAGHRRFVVIGDPSASYAKRLQQEVEKTATYFDDIGLFPPPSDKSVGTLPALVLYVGNHRAVTYRGTSDVYLQLSRIRRGEFN